MKLTHDGWWALPDAERQFWIDYEQYRSVRVSKLIKSLRGKDGKGINSFTVGAAYAAIARLI